MKFTNLYLLAFLFIGIAFTSCDKDDDDNGLDIPSAYDDSNFAANTAEVQAEIQNFRDIVAEMKNGDGDNNGTIDATNATNLLNAGNPSVYDLTTSYYRDLLTPWFDEAKAASNATAPFDFDSVPSPNGVGGVAGAHLLDEHGVELEQLVDKGLYTAFTYHYAVNTYLSGDVTLEEIGRAHV